MSDLDQQTPEQHRARYFALMANARARAGRAPPPPGALDEASVISRETVPGGWNTALRLARGRALRLIDTAGGNGVSVLLWNAHEPSERLNVGDTVKLQWTAAITAGHVLMSDMGRVLASIIAVDAGVRCDLLAGGSTPGSNARKYGAASGRNTRDNFRLIAGKLGLSPRDIAPCLTVFADLRTDESGRFVWGGPAPAGGAIDLRAEMDLLVGISNCPHPLASDTTFAPGPVEAVVWRAPPPAADDPCRIAGEEAMRAFENTASWLAQREAPR
jgi:urea carboxylase-associated protein 2